MLPVTYEEKLAWQSSAPKTLKLEFDGGTVITNENIVSESMSFEQSICEGNELEFGQVSSSCFKVRLFGVSERYIGQRFKATLYVDEYEKQIGFFTVETDNTADDRHYRDIVAYDDLFNVLSTDYADWHNSQPYPMTLKQYRDAFFRNIHLTQQDIVLPNDDMIIEANVVAENYSGADLLYSICELNATMGFINNEGKFQYAIFENNVDALYPAVWLYPMESGLYPKDWVQRRLGGSNETDGTYLQGTLKYEEYDVQPISVVQIRQTDNDVGAVVGSGINHYIIQGNPLVYGKSTPELTTIATNFFNVARYITYTPSEVTCPAGPWMELGDSVGIEDRRNNVILYIMNRTMTGITALLDTYRAIGSEYQSGKANSTNRSLKVLNQRTNELVRTVDETTSTITQVQTDLNNEVTTRQSQITQTAELIQSTVTEERNRATGVESALSSSITQTAAQIDLKVSKGEVSSQIGIESGKINITSNRFSLKSTNCTITEDGKIIASNGEFSGKITASSGSIGGFTIDANSLRADKTSLSDSNEGVYISKNGIALGKMSSSSGIRFNRDGSAIIGYLNMYSSGSAGHSPIFADSSAAGRIRIPRGIDAGWGEQTTKRSLIHNNLTVYGANKDSSPATFYCSNTGKFDGNVSAPNIGNSDIKLKKDIHDLDIEKCMEFIKNLRPVSYRFKQEEDLVHHGFIAQEVEEIADWDITWDDGAGIKNLGYREIIADLTVVVQQLTKRIEELEERLDAAGI